MMAMYSFFIRNYGKFLFRMSDRESFLLAEKKLKAASIPSESGKVLLPFALRSLSGSERCIKCASTCQHLWMREEIGGKSEVCTDTQV
jgi:hypothetical protein